MYLESSKCCADLTKIPKLAPFPVPTMMAVGVASPKAHGQEITRTEIAQFKAKWKSLFPRVNHKMKVMIAIVITVGTKTPLIYQAQIMPEAPPRLTKRMILERVVSFEVCDTSTCI